MGLIDLAGRTALITGAAKRVGRSIAFALADEGVNIVVHYNTSRAPEGPSGEELERLAARAPLGRWGWPEDVANAVVFLMRNDYLTGQVIYVDGGAFIKEDLYG